MPPSTQREAPPDLLARVEEAHVRHIDLQFTDVIGGVKTVTIPASQLSEAIAHGTWFDGSSVDSFARTAESDMYLVPDRVDVPAAALGRRAHGAADLLGDHP